MYVYICINFHDKIIVSAGSVDLKGIKNKSKKKKLKKLTIVYKNFVQNLYTYSSKTKFTVVGSKSYSSIPSRGKSI